MAKIKWLIVLILLAGTTMKAQTGVQFFHGTLAEAMAKAKAEKKLIFIDSYTTWCGPCKVFAANVLTNADVANLYNANFINVKLDIEKGEGPGFASKHSIQQIPTLLFINSEGKVVSRKIGAQQTDSFLDWGRQMSELRL